MKVAVTGASGFVGRHIVTLLERSEFTPVTIRRQDGATAANLHEARILPPTSAPEAEFSAALAGIGHVVHCSGLTNALPDTPETAYFEANALMTGRLASAAATAGVERFVLLSSIRAVVGAAFEGTVTLETQAQPDDAYGRSKLAAERAAQAAFAARPERLTILRLPPVYGPGMKGNLPKLMRLADTPLPLPLAGIAARRSLVGVDGLAELVLALLRRPVSPRRVYLVGDRQAATLPQVLTAFRQGLHRPRRLFSVPQPALAAVAGLVGGASVLRALSATQVSDSTALADDGLPQAPDSIAGLVAAAETWVSVGRPPS